MLHGRIKSVRALMTREGLESVLISYNRDIFYYTGFDVSMDESAFLAIGRSGRPMLFVSPLVNQAERIGGVDVVFYRKTQDVARNLSGAVGYDEGSLKAGVFTELGRKLELREARSIIKEPRIVKDADEISRIRKGIEICKKMLEGIEIVGRAEREIARQLEISMLEAGGEKAFDTIVAGGSNGGYIHYTPKDRVVKNTDLVVVDFGIRLGNYCTDMTRTFCMRPGKKERSLMEGIGSIQKELMDRVHNGMGFKELQYLYTDLMKRKNYTVVHAVGHGIGLDVHERPSMGDSLKPGMVLTIEPGVYIKGFGGCRIEDIILVTKGKAKAL